jgi:hypothetical protein
MDCEQAAEIERRAADLEALAKLAAWSWLAADWEDALAAALGLTELLRRALSEGVRP